MTIRHKWCIAMKVELELKLKFSFICVEKIKYMHINFMCTQNNSLFYFNYKQLKSKFKKKFCNHTTTKQFKEYYAV